MDNIVAIKITDKVGKPHYLLTWGRIFDAVDPQSLFEVLQPHLVSFGLSDFTGIKLCRSLKEASDQPYFYEALFSISQHKIHFGKNYPKWKKKRERKMKSGKEIYYLGSE